MFSRFFKKPPLPKKIEPIDSLVLPSLQDHLTLHDGFCHPDWLAIAATIQKSLSPQDHDQAFAQAAQLWLEKNSPPFGGKHQLYETENFLIFSDLPRDRIGSLSQTLEKALKAILQSLPGIAEKRTLWKFAALIFSSEQDYYDYICHFYPSGEHPMNGGLCITEGGYVHLAVPIFPHANSHALLIHELCHACLAHHHIPSWLNEAIAMRMESLVQHSNAAMLDHDAYRGHLRCWDSKSIQLLWSGDSWHRTGKAFTLAYDLAAILWRKIEQDIGATHEETISFVRQASPDDAGDAACQEIWNQPGRTGRRLPRRRRLEAQTRHLGFHWFLGFRGT